MRMILKYIDIERKNYTQIVKVRFENVDGSFTDYSEAARQDKYYGSKFSWSIEVDDIYEEPTAVSYVVKKENTSYVTIYRKAPAPKRETEIIKAASTMYGDTLIQRTEHDDNWYETVGSYTIDNLKNYSIDKSIQTWQIDNGGNITRVK